MAAAGGVLAQAPPETPFDISLRAVHARAVEGAATAEKLEEEYLALVTPTVTLEERGRVFTLVANLYAEAGQPDATEAYCREALAYPLPPEVAANLYTQWTNALMRRFEGWRGERWRVARHRVVETVLAGLKLVLDNNAPADYLPNVGVGRLSMRSPPPEALARHQKQLDERRRVMALNDLCLARKRMSDLLVYIYTLPPADPDEMKDFTGKALADYPEAVAALVAARDVELNRGRAPQ